MSHFIDRRLNPKDKNLGNRQRFIRRAKAEIKDAIKKSIAERRIADVDKGEDVSIPTKGIGEPRFRNASTGGRRRYVLPGNKEYVQGDRIKKPEQGAGGGGKQGSAGGDGEDAFQFALTRDEFLDLFFEDLKLPDLVKKSLKDTAVYKPQRAGFASDGNPSAIDVIRTMQNSMGRRFSLRRPRRSEVDAAGEVIDTILATPVGEDETLARRLSEAQAAEEALKRRQRSVAFIDPLDVRYRRYTPKPMPNTKAVMFCLMDVSGSMGEREKDLAKHFFVLLHLFLKRRYDRIEIVFIRHTHEASVVDEDTFFYSRETGGTVVSTALEVMHQCIRDRFSPTEWNIYAAQASDGDNVKDDNQRCTRILHEKLMPLVQYFAYVEIGPEPEKERPIDIFAGRSNAFWDAYQTVAAEFPNFATKRVARPGDIYPVFRELFAA